MDGSYSYLCGPEKQIQTWATIGPHIKYHKMAMFFIGIMMIKSRFPVCQPPRFHINMVACSMFILTHPTNPTTITRHQKLVGANTLDPIKLHLGRFIQPMSSETGGGLTGGLIIGSSHSSGMRSNVYRGLATGTTPVVAAAGTVTGSRVLRRQDRLSNSLVETTYTESIAWFWVNYYNSLTWNVGPPLGMLPLTKNHDSSSASGERREVEA